MTEHRPSTLLMVRPHQFGYNPETAVDNAYMNQTTAPDTATKALAEFDNMVNTLEEHDIATLVVQDTPQPATPDSIFPNNWASYHSDGTVVLYPMRAKNRQAETEKDVLPKIDEQFAVSHTIDLRPLASEGLALEGTGSIIFDHPNKTAYANYSQRTNKALFRTVCQKLGYQPIGFNAVDQQGYDIYHTNVLMNIGEGYAVLCWDAIKRASDRGKIYKSLINSGRRNIIGISQAQVQQFAGNMYQAYSRDGKPYTLLSQTAYNAIPWWDKDCITQSGSELLPISVPTIEQVGGGSVRCMVADINLPPKAS